MLGGSNLLNCATESINVVIECVQKVPIIDRIYKWPYPRGF